MIYVEAALLTILVYVCCTSTVTDIKEGIIYNRKLLFCGLSGGVLNIVYYYIFAREYFISFAINFSVITIISLIFYGYHIWAGGDSKLFIIVAFLIPARIYGPYQLGLVPGLGILISTFSLAFVYIAIESIIIATKNRRLLNFKLLKKTDLKLFFKQYLYCVVYLTAFNQIIFSLLPSSLQLHSSTFLILYMVFILTIMKFDFFKPVMLVVSVVLIIFSNILTGVSGISMPDYRLFALLVVLILIRKVVQQETYQEILTEEIKPGMVLSFATVALFLNSRIQGLPLCTTEDLGSRITVDEAESIKRWKQSKKGNPTITIVRKIPFAVFITAGTFVFIFIRVCAYAI